MIGPFRKTREAARIFWDAGAGLPVGAATPTPEQWRRESINAGVSIAALRALAQVESRQAALVDLRPPIWIDGGRWVQFGGRRKDLPKPLNAERMDERWEAFQALGEIDRVRAIAATRFGLFQQPGFTAYLSGYVDERNFLEAQHEGAWSQLEGMGRLIQHRKNAALLAALQSKDAAAIAHHWHGPDFAAVRYDEKIAAGLRRFA